MSAHTPGPWIAKGLRVLPPGSCGVVECCGVAECFHGSDLQEAEANACLIAAAPEMLRVLCALNHALVVMDGYEEKPSDLMYWAEMASAAIAKARP